MIILWLEELDLTKMSLFSNPNVVPNLFYLFQLGNTKVDILKNVCAALFNKSSYQRLSSSKENTHKKIIEIVSMKSVWTGHWTENVSFFFQIVMYLWANGISNEEKSETWFCLLGIYFIILICKSLQSQVTSCWRGWI